MQETAYIIKQDGMPLGHTIRWMILSGGFQIVANKYLKLPMCAFEALYPRHEHPKVPDDVWRFNTVFNTTGSCEIGILRSENATERFLKLAGHHSNPLLRRVGSIRREFGVYRANTMNGYPIHLKVIHRSETQKEAARDLMVIRSLIGA